MQNSTHAISRFAGIVVTVVALMLGLVTITTTQAAAAPSAPVIEAGIPEDRECVLRDAAGTPVRVVADTDPRCKVQGQEAEQVLTLVVVPDMDTIETTPVVCRIEQGPADGAGRWETCVPEESPRGGYVTGIYEDGLASYTDGYTISVAHQDGTTAGAVLGKWKGPKASRAQHA